LSAAQFLLLPITEGRRPQVRTAQSSHACRPAWMQDKRAAKEALLLK
jgi:hypothetical protein